MYKYYYKNELLQESEVDSLVNPRMLVYLLARRVGVNKKEIEVVIE